MQKRTNNKIVKDSFRKHLSIQFNLGGFSFCISDVVSYEIQNFTSYSFDEVCNSPEELLKEIEAVVKDNSFFKQDFETVTVIHQNTLSTLVPDALFNPEELNTYLDYNIKTLTTDFIAFDSLSQIEAKNVYVPYVNINNFFFQKFGEFTYKHHATVLIDKLLLKTKNSTDKQFYVNVSKQQIDIVVIERSKLLFSNSFIYNTKEDFIYYILFTAEQLELNPEKLLLYFCGDINTNDEIYLITYQYIRNVDFVTSSTHFFDTVTDLESHTFYTTIP